MTIGLAVILVPLFVFFLWRIVRSIFPPKPKEWPIHFDGLGSPYPEGSYRWRVHVKGMPRGYKRREVP